MKVLLRENLEKIGKRGDVIDVKAGFARNYLLPRNLAWPATKEFMARLEAEKRKYDLRMAKFKEERQELAERLKQIQINLTVRAVEEGERQGKLYGAIHARHILDAFKKSNIVLEESNIILPNPVEEVGKHHFKIHVHAEIPDVDGVLIVNPA